MGLRELIRRRNEVVVLDIQIRTGEDLVTVHRSMQGALDQLDEYVLTSWYEDGPGGQDATCDYIPIPSTPAARRDAYFEYRDDEYASIHEGVLLP